MAVRRRRSATAERATHGCCRSEDSCIRVLPAVLRPAVLLPDYRVRPILTITTRTIQGSVLDLVSDSAGPGRTGARGGIRTPTPLHIPIRPRMRTLIRTTAYDNTGSARLLINPRNAQVYVDGQFLGLVGEFDGSPQRLHVPIGATRASGLPRRISLAHAEGVVHARHDAEDRERASASSSGRAVRSRNPHRRPQRSGQILTRARHKPLRIVRVNAPNPGPCHSASTLPTRRSSSTARPGSARRERAGLRSICPKVRIRSKFGSRATAGTREASTFSAVKRCR